MQNQLVAEIKLLNPWLDDPSHPVIDLSEYRPRLQSDALLSPEWDKQWLVLIGPRRAGKTTIGKYLCSEFINQEKYDAVLYLNCDYLLIRQALKSPAALIDIFKHFKLKHPIVFIDEVQRIENPGLFLKAVADLELGIKMIASGSSQLEIRSKVQEHLTGRQFVSHILPLSLPELGSDFRWEEQALWGSYPQVINSSNKRMQLSQLYDAYIQKDIVEILKVGKPDILQKLLTLTAHSSGQLVNFNQLATDCGVASRTVQHYLSILEQTFVLKGIQPFVGNKRTEITSNPVYYFLDNGFRNQALDNFSPLEGRQDNGLLVEGLVFQELLKHKLQNFLTYSIHFWRTKSGAEVDFVLNKGIDQQIPIEVKYRKLAKPSITRGYRSFLQAYRPKLGFVVNRSIVAEEEFEGCKVRFLPIEDLPLMFAEL